MVIMLGNGLARARSWISSTWMSKDLSLGLWLHARSLKMWLFRASSSFYEEKKKTTPVNSVATLASSGRAGATTYT